MHEMQLNLHKEIQRSSDALHNSLRDVVETLLENRPQHKPLGGHRQTAFPNNARRGLLIEAVTPAFASYHDVKLEVDAENNIELEDYAVRKLGLEKEEHPSPYKLTWLKEGTEIRGTQKALVSFSIGSIYKDQMYCDVVPMDLGILSLADHDITTRRRHMMGRITRTDSCLTIEPLCYFRMSRLQ
ncbi:hypothetical protein EUTSA_v10010900mg [Eutrema salsugineum]|uniref:Uncharacterized protein n=1 Tax=Eutrema salsugineum TaxID=72664 RepID=V4M125_EUTSA|nr:hypothetical protein EUTSA_v10010900mg [Eutrema salsugineum]